MKRHSLTIENFKRKKRYRSAGAKGILFGKGFEQDFAPLELQRYGPRVVTERKRGTAKNRVSVSLSVIFLSC
jgi:hypothetical protein